MLRNTIEEFMQFGTLKRQKKKKKNKGKLYCYTSKQPNKFFKGSKRNEKKKTKKNWEQRRNAVAGLFFIKCDVHFTHK